MVLFQANFPVEHWYGQTACGHEHVLRGWADICHGQFQSFIYGIDSAFEQKGLGEFAVKAGDEDKMGLAHEAWDGIRLVGAYDKAVLSIENRVEEDDAASFGSQAHALNLVFVDRIACCAAHAGIGVKHEAVVMKRHFH